MVIRVVPGAICEEKGSQAEQMTVSLNRIVSLLGVAVSIPPGSGDGEVWIQGAPKLSKLIVCKPCGDKEERTSFWYAVRGGVLLSPSLNGLCMIHIGKETNKTTNNISSTSSSSGTITNDNAKPSSASSSRTRGIPAHVRLTSNKYRLVFTVVPSVTVTGLMDESTLSNMYHSLQPTSSSTVTDKIDTASNLPFDISTNLQIDHRSSGLQLNSKVPRNRHISSESSATNTKSSSTAVFLSPSDTVWVRYRMMGITNKSGNGNLPDPMWLKVKRNCIIGPGAEGNCYRLLGLRKMYRNDLAKLQSLFSTSFTISAYDLVKDSVGINVTDIPKDKGTENAPFDEKKDAPTSETVSTKTNVSTQSTGESVVSEYITRYLMYEDIHRSMADIQMYMKNIWIDYIVKRIIIVQRIVRGWLVRYKQRNDKTNNK